MKIFKKLYLAVATLLVALPSIAFGQANVELTYGQPFILNFHLVESDGSDLRTDAACASGDVTIMKDQGSEVNSTNCFVDEGKGYSISLTSAELTASQLTIYVVDQTTPKAWLDKVVHITTVRTAPVGVAQAGAAGYIDLATSAPSTDDIYNNNFTVAITQGTGADQSRCIIDYTGSTRRATVASNWTVNPDDTSQYILLYTPNCNGAIGANSITSATLDSSALNAISTNLLGRVVETEGSITVQGFMRLAGAVLYGTSDNNGLRFKTPNGAANRVTITVNANKERTASSINP